MSVFFVSRKTGFKSWLNTSLIPLRYLAVCQASSAFSYCNPDSFLIPGGLIELLFLVLMSCSLTPPRYLLDTSTVNDHFSTPSSTGVSIPLDTCICRDLLLTPFKLPMRSGTRFIRYLSRYFSVFSPKLSHLTPIFVPQGFFKLSQEFLHLVSV